MSKVETERSTVNGNTETAEPKTLPSLETVDRILKLPAVETAWKQSQDLYGKVKKSNQLFSWAFSATEGAIQRTAKSAVPLVHKLDGPILLVDRTLVKGIDKLETAAPIVKEAPQQIYEQTKSRITQYLNLAGEKEDSASESEENGRPTENDKK